MCVVCLCWLLRGLSVSAAFGSWDAGTVHAAGEAGPQACSQHVAINPVAWKGPCLRLRSVGQDVCIAWRAVCGFIACQGTAASPQLECLWLICVKALLVPVLSRDQALLAPVSLTRLLRRWYLDIGQPPTTEHAGGAVQQHA